MIAPWTIRNAVRFHAFVPVSNNVATLVDGANCDATYGGAAARPVARDVLASSATDRADRAPAGPGVLRGIRHRRSALRRGQGREHATRARARPTPAHHLGSLPKVAVVRVLRTWGLYAPSAAGRLRVARRTAARLADARHRHVLGAGCRSRSWARSCCRRRRRLLWPLAATARDGDDRRGVDLRPAALPDRGRARALVLAAVALDAAWRRLRTADNRDSGATG